MIDGCLRLEWVSGAVGRTGSAPKRPKIATYAISPVNPVRNFLPALRCIRVCRPQPSRAATPRHADALRPSLSEESPRTEGNHYAAAAAAAAAARGRRLRPDRRRHRLPTAARPTIRPGRKIVGGGSGGGSAGPESPGRTGAGWKPGWDRCWGAWRGREGAAAGVARPEAGWRAAFLAAP